MGITVVEAYSVLEIESTATPDQIKTAYRKMALKTHPDKNSNDPDAKAKFQRVSEAYKRLTDPNANEDEEEEFDVSEEEMFAMFNEMFGGMLGAMGGMFFVPGMMDPFADFLDDEDEDDEDDDMYFDGGAHEAEDLAELLMAAGAMGGKQGDAAMRRMFGIPSDEEFPYGVDEGAGKSKKAKKKQKGTSKKGSTKYYAEHYDDEFDSDDYGDMDGEDMSALMEAMMMMGMGGMVIGLGGGTGRGGRRGAGYPAPPCAQGMGLGGGLGGKSGNNKKKKNKKKDKGIKKEANGSATGRGESMAQEGPAPLSGMEDKKLRAPPSASAFRDPPAMSNTKLQVGCPVLLRQRHKGWVRYRGPVHYGEGEWVGVELEDKGAGKNNGTVKGVSYFKCPSNTGVMVRASELQPI